MKERERNKRLLTLLDKLINEGDFESIELLKTMINNDSDSMKHSFKLMTSRFEELIQV